MSRLDPPLRYYHSPPITHILSDSPLTLDAAHTLVVDFLALAPTHPELHPHASFTHHGLKFPQSNGGAAAMSDGNLAMLGFVERGMKGEDARKEVEERKRLQREEEKTEVDLETAKPKAKKRKKEGPANGEEQQWDWEDPSVLGEKSEAEDGGRSWAASASVTATNVKKVPEVKDTAEEDAND
jgi:hypothetical protein